MNSKVVKHWSLILILSILGFVLTFRMSNANSNLTDENSNLSNISNLMNSNISNMNLPKDKISTPSIPDYIFNDGYDKCLVEDEMCANVSGGCLIDLTTNTMIWGKNIHNSFRIASMTKMMTALVILESISKNEISLDTKVTVSPKTEEITGSIIFLRAGEVFTVKELLKAMLVSSANDAAFQLAEFVAGSEAEFVDRMNKKARELGLAKTHFDNSSGLPPYTDEDKVENYSTPFELTIIGGELTKYSEIHDIVSIKTEPFAEGHKALRNTNPMVCYFPGVIGIKSGWYYKAGHNSTLLAKRGDHTFIMVIQGAKNKYHRDGLASKLFMKAYADIELPLSQSEIERVTQINTMPKSKQPIIQNDNLKKHLSKKYLDSYLHSVH